MAGLAGCRNVAGQCWTDSHICPPHQEKSHGYVDLCSVQLQVAKWKASGQMPEMLQENHYLLQFRIKQKVTLAREENVLLKQILKHRKYISPGSVSYFTKVCEWAREFIAQVERMPALISDSMAIAEAGWGCGSLQRDCGHAYHSPFHPRKKKENEKSRNWVREKRDGRLSLEVADKPPSKHSTAAHMLYAEPNLEWRRKWREIAHIF